MNWNNDKLNEIQQIEYNLINSINCGSDSKLFTTFIHSTSEWIDKESNAKDVHISQYKTELDKLVEMVAYYIECGYITETAFSLCGTSVKRYKDKLTDTHIRILQQARKQRSINKQKNK